MKRIILFDLDGTLVDSLPGIHAALQRTLRDYRLRSTTPEQTRSFIGDGATTLLARALDAAGAPTTDVREATRRFLIHYADTSLSGTHLFDGARAMLDALWHSGHAMGLCTNKPQVATHALLTKLGLSQYFKVVVAGDTLPVRKPHPEHLRFAIRYIAADDQHPALMVGDTRADVLAAQAARIPVAVVTFGYSAIEGPLKTADYTVHTLNDVTQLVFRMG